MIYNNTSNTKILASLPVKAKPQQQNVFQLTPDTSPVFLIVNNTRTNPKHYIPAARVKIKL